MTFCLIPPCAPARPVTTDASPESITGAKHVLILYSYNFNQPAQQEIAAGLETARRIAHLNTDDCLHEFLDISPPRNPQQRLMLSRLLLRKYAGRRFDLIITVFNDALDFLMNEGQDLSPDSPCLALYAQKRPHLERAGKPVFQSPLYYDIPGTLNLALKLFPRTRTVLFVSGTSILDMAYEHTARADFLAWRQKLEFEFTSGLSMDELLRRVGRLPPETVVIYARISSDVTGKAYLPIDVATEIAKTSNAPVFCLATSQLETGVVGGSMVDVKDLSAMLGKVLPSLMGDHPRPLEPASRFIKPMLNWQQIKRWGISTSRLPAGSVIINRPPTLWSQHRRAVILAMMVFLFLTGFIIALAMQSNRRKKAEQSSRESQARYRILIDRAPDAIVVYDVDLGRLVDASASAEKLFGCSRDELLQAGPLRFYQPEQPDQRKIEESFSEHNERVLAGEELQFERSIHSANGRDLFCEVCLIRLPPPNRRLIRASFVNITGRKRSEEALKKSEERFRRLAENAKDMIYRMSLPGGNYEYVSPASLEITGYSPAEFYDNPLLIQKTVHPDWSEFFIQEWENLKKGSMSPSYEYKIIHKSGEERWLYQRNVLILNEQGQPMAIEGIVTDITERKRLEEQLLQSQKMESIGRLAGGVAHDFNNLLTAIAGNAELALLQADIGPRVSGRLKLIQQAADHAAELTKQLLAFSRKQIIEPQVIDLNELIWNMGKMLSRVIGEDITLRSTNQPGLHHIKVDAGQMQQIIMNLAVNARDAMPDGGILNIETADVVLDEAYCRRHEGCKPGEHIMLSVSDTGIGMSAEVKQHLFEPFFTTKAMGKGTGLGLATVYGAVKQNGGTIEIYSEPGMGTCFKMYFPAVAIDTAPLPKEPSAEKLSGGSETVLLVEDDPGVLEFTRSVLEMLGYHVMAASSGEEALSMARDYAGPIQLLMTDVILSGMNGRQVAEALTADRPGLKVLFNSGYTKNTIVHHGVLEHDLHFIAKPFTAQALARKLREVLDEV
ncbi:MAG: PAS domain S-box protein [Syntrophaceae bacterium]